MQNNTLTLRPFKDTDMERFAAWLGKAHVAKWYHHPEDWLEELRGQDGEYAWIHHFIVMDGDTPIGFAQYYDGYDAGDMEDWYEAPCPGDTFSIDYMIGEEAYLGKGCGKAIVALLTEQIRTAENGRQIVVQPEKENHASNGVLLANGYRYDEAREYYYKLLK